MPKNDENGILHRLLTTKWPKHRKKFDQNAEKYLAKTPNSLVDSLKNVYTIIVISDRRNDYNEKI